MSGYTVAGLCVLSDWYNPEADRLELAYWVLLSHGPKPRSYMAFRLLPGAQQGPMDLITLEREQVIGARPWEPRRDYYAIEDQPITTEVR